MAKKRGVAVYFRKVVRPAIKAQPFLVPAAAVGREAMEVAIRTGLSNLPSTKMAAVNAVLAESLKVRAFVVLASAQGKAPVNKGRLRRSLSARKRGQYLWTVGTNVVYAQHVEFGTKGGTIRPKHKKALRFIWRNAPASVAKRFRKRRRRKKR